MRIFLTGATGYIGSAALDALVRAGHDVTAIVRTPEKAKGVEARGAHPVVGDLSNPDSYRQEAEDHDGYVLAAVDHSARKVDVDRSSIETLVALARARRPPTVLIYTSGVWVIGKAVHPAHEDVPVNPSANVAFRPAHERLVLDAAGHGLRTAVVRPGIVYGGGSGIIGDLFKDASNGLIRVIGEGENRWPLVYDRDLASLYVRLVGQTEASGIYHANDEGDERVNDIVNDIAAHMPVRPDVRHVPMEEARHKFGPVADAMALDQVVRSPRAHALGWVPTLRSVAGNVPGLLEEWGAARR